MKKLFALIVIVLSVFMFSGCNNNDDVNSDYFEWWNNSPDSEWGDWFDFIPETTNHYTSDIDVIKRNIQIIGVNSALQVKYTNVIIDIKSQSTLKNGMVYDFAIELSDVFTPINIEIYNKIVNEHGLRLIYVGNINVNENGLHYLSFTNMVDSVDELELRINNIDPTVLIGFVITNISMFEDI